MDRGINGLVRSEVRSLYNALNPETIEHFGWRRGELQLRASLNRFPPSSSSVFFVCDQRSSRGDWI
jgi:hypothetical protein